MMYVIKGIPAIAWLRWLVVTPRYRPCLMQHHPTALLSGLLPNGTTTQAASCVYCQPGWQEGDPSAVSVFQTSEKEPKPRSQLSAKLNPYLFCFGHIEMYRKGNQPLDWDMIGFCLADPRPTRCRLRPRAQEGH